MSKFLVILNKFKQWIGYKVLLIVGLCWGDEGKGQVVLRIMRFLKIDYVVRWHGGPNAGHQVDLGDGRKTTFSQLPSGLALPGTMNFMAAGMVIDPVKLFAEMEKIKLDLGVTVTPGNLMVDGRAGVIFELYRIIEGKAEIAAGKDAVGTTMQGIGPAYEAKKKRRGLMVYDLLDRDRLFERLTRIVEIETKLGKFNINQEVLDAWFEELFRVGEKLKPFVGDVARAVVDLKKQRKRGAGEGAQGLMLDINFGTWPYVTSSSTIASSFPSEVGIGNDHVGFVLGVFKAYTTRVGNGPFPTCDKDDFGKYLHDVGKEVGSRTGRDRDCGADDIPGIIYAIWHSGITAVYLTKLDILSGLDKIPIGVRYLLDGQLLDEFPADPYLLDYVTVEYEYMDGWTEDISGCTEFSQLPINAQKYVLRIQELIGVPILFIGVGPSMNQEIVRWDEIEFLLAT